MSTSVTRMPGDVSAAEHRRQIISNQLGRWIPLMVLAIMSGRSFGADHVDDLDIVAFRRRFIHRAAEVAAD